MPTEELFGAYNFLLEVAGNSAKDSFDFKAAGEPQTAALLLPAVQAAREAARRTDAEPTGDSLYASWDEHQSSDAKHDDWIDVLSIDWGSGKPATATPTLNLQSDGELVQDTDATGAVSDFIL